LIAGNVDPDFVSYIIRKYDLVATLTSDEYEATTEVLDTELNVGGGNRYATLLLPLVSQYELKMSRTSPDGFLSYAKRLFSQGTLNKPQIAQYVISQIEGFF